MLHLSRSIITVSGGKTASQKEQRHILLNCYLLQGHGGLVLIALSNWLQLSVSCTFHLERAAVPCSSCSAASKYLQGSTLNGMISISTSCKQSIREINFISTISQWHSCLILSSATDTGLHSVNLKHDNRLCFKHIHLACSGYRCTNVHLKCCQSVIDYTNSAPTW